MGMERRRLVANSFKQSMVGLPRYRRAADAPLGELSGSLKMGLRFVVSFGCGVYHALRADGALTFFASPKKVSKERRPRRAGLLRRLPSLSILFSARAN